MLSFRSVFAAATALIVTTFALPATAAQMGSGMAPCARTRIAVVKMPSGPAQYQSGRIALRNGASLRLQGSTADLYQAQQLKIGDPVAACYGPPRTYADAGPSRSITVLDLRNGAYYATLIGNWPRL